ncbi:MAG TPA: peptide chain release factor N(5)-glutamine methyltransferase [Turneriella sp.]|nr:peptide chain release factor N(5)-glutamine methyltransferase [Turneriella sp.]
MSNSIPILIDVLRKAENFLAEKKIPSPRLEAQLIFAHFLNLKRIEIFTQSERPLNATELEMLRQALREKITGKPTAYILGQKDFYTRTFKVDSTVLIPRPETEELVEHVLKKIPSTKHIVDLGTGSGCIGVTLAAESGCERITLVDISRGALSIAEENAARHIDGAKTKIVVIDGDFTQPSFILSEKADVIVTNPPYVLAEEFNSLDETVRSFEPRLALVADDFYTFTNALLGTIKNNLRPNGFFALETHPQKSHEVAEWARGKNFEAVEVLNDLAARPHFVIGRLSVAQ